MWKRRSKDAVFGPDDYNQPTEPLEESVFPIQATSTYPAGGPAPDALSAQAPRQAVYPLPHAAPYQEQAYPVLPSAPFKNEHGQSPAGAPPVYRPGRLRKRRRSPLPGLVGLVFVLVQLTLLGRVVCMLLGITATTPWLTLLFTASDLFVWPARRLAANINTSLFAGTQLLIYLEFLLLILVYGLLSRFLVRLLKVFLNS